MKVRKGEVTMFISPNQLDSFRKAGWRVIVEHKREKIKEYNERRKLKELAKKGEIDEQVSKS
jgi:hypothetical protein